MIDHISQAYGRLDLLVNNAGVAPKERNDILEASQESFDWIMNILDAIPVEDEEVNCQRSAVSVSLGINVTEIDQQWFAFEAVNPSEKLIVSSDALLNDGVSLEVYEKCNTVKKSAVIPRPEEGVVEILDLQQGDVIYLSWSGHQVSFLWDIQFEGEVITSVEESGIIEGRNLTVFPNPFSGQATIAYQLADAGDVTLELLDVSGRSVMTMVNQHQVAGEYEHAYDQNTDGLPLEKGLYFIRLSIKYDAKVTENEIVRVIKN